MSVPHDVDHACKLHDVDAAIGSEHGSASRCIHVSRVLLEVICTMPSSFIAVPKFVITRNDVLEATPGKH